MIHYGCSHALKTLLVLSPRLTPSKIAGDLFVVIGTKLVRNVREVTAIDHLLHLSGLP